MPTYHLGSSWILEPEELLRFAIDWTMNHKDDITDLTGCEVRKMADAVVPAKTICVAEASIGDH